MNALVWHFQARTCPARYLRRQCKNGRPVSRLVPYREKPKSLFGIDRRKIEIVGNVVEPVDTVWDVETGNTWDGDV